jgi:hypothetical protein
VGVTGRPTEQTGSEVLQICEHHNHTDVQALNIDNYGLIAIPTEFRCRKTNFINTFEG